MLTTFFAAAAVLLTLALPTFPDGLTPAILGFFGLLGLAAVGGALRSRSARISLILFLPWVAALLLGLAVGLGGGTPFRQVLEDSLPYLLFVVGITGGRGAGGRRTILAAILAVAAIDGALSLWRMPSFDLSVVRSTYTSHKVIAGHLLLGLGLAELLRAWRPSPSRRLRGLLGALSLLLLLAIVATVSRGMLLGLAVGVIATLYLRHPIRGLGLGLLGLLIVAIFAGTFWELGARYLRLDAAATVDGRVREISRCLEVFIDRPLVGAGLGHLIVVDGFSVAYVHNLVAYHLWKFGLLGSLLLTLPFLSLAREALRATAPRSSQGHLRPLVVGLALSLGVYLVTAASYKSYFMVPMVGLAVGALLGELQATRRATLGDR